MYDINVILVLQQLLIKVYRGMTPFEFFFKKKEAFTKLLDMTKLIEQTYRPSKITPNIFERMNGLLATPYNKQIVIQSKIKQYSRLRLGSDIYGSTISARHIKLLFVLAKFIQDNGEIDTYPGQIQFFFEHTTLISDLTNRTHSLALIKWFKPVKDYKTHFYCQVNNDIENCNIEIWIKNFYQLSRDSIIPIHNLYSKFIKCDFNIGKRNPINI
ncbi:hypothetical protein Glove_196g101 [Diversispora epigaea]|uniref:Uncharacterized protein n=1 Tax=Diversispora epigaea TaxID=1348612 RepID=A0A397INM7_9GLOM|nr:hypothetical protein Glove_196g101 [Diversispora epigaea]